eukprot:NODE_999_length_1274_cov_325.026251.p1 GENE.NODE_999_length_1274_cov_325.026251~~NODE_999_length_1274_cov_325.026251.p1  ORF type:complete len:367 (+),score=90.58 NODE_999_length_1274_cov_325.026251:3-1103(+)
MGSTALGNLFGYAVCGYLVDIGVYYQRAFQIQAFWLLATCFFLVGVPCNRLNISNKRELVDLPLCNAEYVSKSHAASAEVDNEAGHRLWVLKDGDEGKGMGPLAQISALAVCPVFVLAVAALCALYFVVTAVQFWASTYFTIVFQRPGSEVTTMFILVAGTAPILGVVIGSAVVDRLGGYETAAQMARTLGLTTAWCSGAVVAGVAAALIAPLPPDMPGSSLRFAGVVISIWFLLLFGGALLPAVTGISMAAVPESLRKSASSWSMLLYNVLGYSLGAYLPGYVAEYVSLRFAMQVVFLWAGLCFILLAWAYVLAQRSIPRNSAGNSCCRPSSEAVGSAPHSLETNMALDCAWPVLEMGSLRSRGL